MQSVMLKQEELPYEIDEELKMLRTNIQFTGADKKVLLLTSAFSGEGKSTTALNLCRSFTELGKRVLLVDADMRNSGFMKMLKGSAPSFGLSHYLSGQCEMDEMICSSDIKNLSVIVSGKVPPNPAELLARPAMKTLIDTCTKYCDYIVIDCPPLGMVVDAAVVAPLCDGAMLVIEAGEVKYRLAQEVVAKLQNTSCPLLGVILNKVGYSANGKYYGHYGKYGKYGKYGYGKYGKYGYGHYGKYGKPAETDSKPAKKD